MTKKLLDQKELWTLLSNLKPDWQTVSRKVLFGYCPETVTFCQKDSLTNLPAVVDREKYSRYLKTKIEKVRTLSGTVVFLRCDMMQLKALNDKYSFEYGNANVLFSAAKIADALVAIFGELGEICPFRAHGHGDEFEAFVFLPGSVDNLQKLIDELDKQLRVTFTFPLNGRKEDEQVEFGLAYGVAVRRFLKKTVVNDAGKDILRQLSDEVDDKLIRYKTVHEIGKLTNLFAGAVAGGNQKTGKLIEGIAGNLGGKRLTEEALGWVIDLSAVFAVMSARGQLNQFEDFLRSLNSDPKLFSDRVRQETLHVLGTRSQKLFLSKTPLSTMELAKIEKWLKIKKPNIEADSNHHWTGLPLWSSQVKHQTIDWLSGLGADYRMIIFCSDADYLKNANTYGYGFGDLYIRWHSYRMGELSIPRTQQCSFIRNGPGDEVMKIFAFKREDAFFVGGRLKEILRKINANHPSESEAVFLPGNDLFTFASSAGYADIGRIPVSQKILSVLEEGYKLAEGQAKIVKILKQIKSLDLLVGSGTDSRLSYYPTREMIVHSYGGGRISNDSLDIILRVLAVSAMKKCRLSPGYLQELLTQEITVLYTEKSSELLHLKKEVLNTAEDILFGTGKRGKKSQLKPKLYLSYI